MSNNADKMREAYEKFVADFPASSGPLPHEAFAAGAQWATPDPQHWQTVLDAAKGMSRNLNVLYYLGGDAVALRAALRCFEERGME